MTTESPREGELTRDELRAVPIVLDDSPTSRAALNAINQLVAEFGKQWILSAGAHLPFHFIEAWSNWSTIRDMQGAKAIKDRWRDGFDRQGVIPEVRVLAAIRRAIRFLELFPAVNNRVLDCRFKCFPESRWIYVEISKRAISDLSKASQQQLSDLAAAAHAIAKGKHAHIALLRAISDEEHRNLLCWLTESNKKTDAPFEYARFGITELPDGPSKPIYSKEWANSVMNREANRPCTYVGKVDSVSVGTAYLVVDDFDIERYLGQEAEQLQHGAPGVLILDVTNVFGGLDKCAEVVRARMQPKINTRVSGVALINAYFEGTRIKYHGQLIVNQHARDRLTPSEVHALKSVFD